MQLLRGGWPLLLASLALTAPARASDGLSTLPGLPGLNPEKEGDSPFPSWTLPGHGSSTPAPARNERALFERARSYLDDAAYETATQLLQDFLRDYPRSRLAPEASYRLAATRLLLDHPQQARKLFESLVTQYPDSPWARLVLLTHFDEGQLLAQITERRQQAVQSKKQAKAAVDLLDVYQRRFPTGKLNRAEVVYKLGVCHRLADNEDAFAAAMRAVQEAAPDSVWGRLAAFQLGDRTHFQDGLEKLYRLSANKEELYALLDLAGRFEPAMDAEHQVRCRYWRVVCLGDLGRDKEARVLCRKVLSEQADSGAAADCQFWLAEHYYRHKEISRAEAEYKSLMKRYPHSARVEQARRWLAWLEGHDDAWSELEGVVARYATTAPDSPSGLGFRAVMRSSELGGSLRCRVAFQGTDRFLLELAAGNSGIVLANNEEGGWYRALGERVAFKARQRIELPRPHCEVGENSADGTMSLNFSWLAPTRDAGPCLVLPLRIAPSLVSSLQEQFHLCRTSRTVEGKTTTTFQMESASWAADDLIRVELEVSAEQEIKRVRYERQSGTEKTECILSDVVLNGPLPADAFQVALPKGTEVRCVERVNLLDSLGHLLKTAAHVMDGMRKDEKK